MKTTIVLALLASIGLVLCARAGSEDPADPTPSRAIPVRIERMQGGWTLLRGGKPFVIKGAGGSQTHLEDLVKHGGNAIRTWDGEGIDELLDRAHELGVAVCVGIWLGHERHGFDYDDPESRARQLEKVERIVRAHRDHPAVLMWGVGNEVELQAEDWEKAFRSVEDAAKLIKSLDPHHPTMAVVAEIFDGKGAMVQRMCPSIDIIGVNSYGGASSVPGRLLEHGYDGPYVLAEFGPTGHWESASTDWEAPIEPTSTEKANQYAERYEQAVQSEIPGRCLGSFVFLWGDKQETTSTWFGMFLRTGEKVGAVDEISKAWTGKWPENRAPAIAAVTSGLDRKRVAPGQEFEVRVRASDADGDPLKVEYLVTAETTDRRAGGDRERRPQEFTELTVQDGGMTGLVRTPDSPGAYRVFVTIRDGRGAAATANLPFFVE